MTLVYNHIEANIGALGRLWKHKNGEFCINPIDGKGKLIFLNNEYKHLLSEFGKYKMDGDMELIKDGLFYGFTPNNVELVEKQKIIIPNEYVYGGRIRIFFTDGTNKLVNASCISDALSMTDKAHLYDFYQTE
jgi:hypothetical protein